MSKERIPSAAEIRKQIPAARTLAAQKHAAGLYAESAWYDPPSGRVMLALTDGVLVGIPVRDIPYLAKATPDQLKAVTLTPAGTAVCWDQLDVDVSVEGLLIDTLGRRPFLAAMGRTAGRVKSPAKTRAARANGAKGGRPRKHAA